MLLRLEFFHPCDAASLTQGALLRSSTINVTQCFLHQLDYMVTCAVCTRTDAGDIHIHKKKTQVMQT